MLKYLLSSYSILRFLGDNLLLLFFYLSLLYIPVILQFKKKKEFLEVFDFSFPHTVIFFQFVLFYSFQWVGKDVLEWKKALKYYDNWKQLSFRYLFFFFLSFSRKNVS